MLFCGLLHIRYYAMKKCSFKYLFIYISKDGTDGTLSSKIRAILDT